MDNVPTSPSAPLQWFVLRPTYSRAQKAATALTALGFEVYMPLIHIKHVVREQFNKAHVEYVEEPLVKNLIFIRASYASVSSLLRNHQIDYVTPYYDHFHRNEFGQNDYLTVPDDAMESFRKVVDSRNRDILKANPDEIHFQTGQWVRVTEGEFAGVTGRVARYKGQQRVFVHLQGICMVATAYVPSAFLEAL